MDGDSFKKKYPELMKEWAYIDNLLICRPDQIPPVYQKNVWWICPHCQKKYYMSPLMRVYYKQKKKPGCPYCRKR